MPKKRPRSKTAGPPLGDRPLSASFNERYGQLELSRQTVP